MKVYIYEAYDGELDHSSVSGATLDAEKAVEWLSKFGYYNHNEDDALKSVGKNGRGGYFRSTRTIEVLELEG